MKKSVVLVVSIFVMLSLLLGACKPKVEEPTKTESPVEVTKPQEPTTPAVVEETTEAEPQYPTAPEFIEVGSSISLTGNFGSLGNLILPGYQIAIEHINADGGVFVKEYNTKIPLRLTHYDDESDPTKAVAKMETLYSEKPLTAYLGGGGSSMHAAAIPIAEKNQVPYLSISFALYQIHQ
jgi:ABC-type branched-subunit amino acid transport system substrate-binding protein